MAVEEYNNIATSQDGPHAAPQVGQEGRDGPEVDREGHPRPKDDRDGPEDGREGQHGPDEGRHEPEDRQVPVLDRPRHQH